MEAQGTARALGRIRANQISRYITFSVPASSLGHPGSGWGFSVVLTGQDGFSSDQARGFTTIPGQYSFGVCAALSTDPHSTVDPSTLPNALSVIIPSAVLQ